jgi:hypothetical protein
MLFMNTVSNDVIDKIIKIVKDGGGEVYEQPGYVNFCGVRNNATNDTFNDVLYIYWKENGVFKGICTNGFTTKPGKRVILNENGKTTSKGAAILKEGWHKNIWHIGKHKGEYTALRSTANVTNPTTVTRDNTQFGRKGSKYELRIFDSKTDVGHFGINFHKSGSPQGNSVNGWSAGCQVFKLAKEFKEMLNMAQSAAKKGQKTFSYFLVNKTVLDGKGVVSGSGTPYDFSQSQFGGSGSSGSSSGSYGGCGDVHQLGSYSNSPNAHIPHKQTQSREDVLNTLVGGSYTPDQIKKCPELMTSDKKKENKTKSKS